MNRTIIEKRAYNISKGDMMTVAGVQLTVIEVLPEDVKTYITLMGGVTMIVPSLQIFTVEY